MGVDLSSRGLHNDLELDSNVGKRVRITFKDGSWCEGTLDTVGWKYGMNGCEWTGQKRGLLVSHYRPGWIIFSKSDVRSIESSA